MHNKKIWVVWRYESDQKNKPTKVPYRVTGGKASTTDTSSWATFDEAQKVRDKYDGLGFCFDGSMLGVDLDHVLKDGLVNPQVEQFIHEANTYTEISPSRNGLHLIFKLCEPLVLTSHKKKNPDGTGYECYTEKRFFTYTGDTFTDLPIRAIDSVEATALLSMLGYPWREEDTRNEPSLLTLMPEIGEQSDSEVLTLMFGSKHGAAIQKLYDGDTTQYNNDTSSADMAFCNHLAFWTRKNPTQMERLWMASPLGQREKTGKRKDYRSATITRAIERTKDVYTPKRVLSSYTTADFVGVNLRRSKSGIPYNDSTNVLIALKGNPKYAKTIRFNQWTLEVEYGNGAISEKDILDIQHDMQANVGLNGVQKNTVYEAIQKLAFDNQYDEVLEWLENTPWDGTPRLESWLQHTCGVEQDVYMASIGQNWLVGMVNRIVNPGSVFDYVLTLVGGQGTGKTSLFRIIGGKWYKAHTESVDNKDFMLKLRGACLIDLDEGATLSRSDSIKLKSVITEICDEYRAPYDRVTQKYPRRFVFSMSTNDTEPFRDMTGNRRYWIVRVPRTVNFAWLTENRDQLFAEAYHIVKNKLPILDVPLTDAQRYQDEATPKDEWFNAISQWLSEQIDYPRGHPDFNVTVRDIYEGALGGEQIHRLDRATEQRIGGTLRNEFGFIRRKVQVDSVRTYRYFLSEKEQERLQAEYNN